MAIQKEIRIRNTGVTASYWTLSKIEVDFISGSARITMAGFLDAADHSSGNGPITKKIVDWSANENPITAARIQAGTAFSAAFTKLISPETNPFKPQNPFEGATIV